MAEVATERLRLRDTDIGWPLEEMWVTGDLLGLADTLEAGAVVLVQPSVEELAEQLPTELAVARRHLGAVLEAYWDHDWRRRHSGNDESPEDHLWRAATAVTDIWAALDGLRS